MAAVALLLLALVLGAVLHKVRRRESAGGGRNQRAGNCLCAPAGPEQAPLHPGETPAGGAANAEEEPHGCLSSQRLCPGEVTVTGSVLHRVLFVMMTSPPLPLQFDTVPDTTGVAGSVTLKGFSMRMEVSPVHPHTNKRRAQRPCPCPPSSPLQDALEAKCEPVRDAPPQGELGVLSVNSLRRSVSQLMDGKSVGEGEAWDPNTSGHDSGMVRDPKNVC